LALESVRSRYTGKERDTESGNDYFGARYYASSMGRFMSPDPSQLYYADPTNPQSFNLYSYGRNNPLINTDPSGMECVWDDGSYDAADDKQTGNAAGCSGQGGTYVDPNTFENAALTNGQNANIQYGSWSGQADSNLAQNWTSPSITSDATPQNVGVTYDNFGTAHFNLDPNYNYNSPEFVNRPTSSIGPTPPPKKLTPAQIQYWCAVAASLGGGGTVPGGIDPSAPSDDTPPHGMEVPSSKPAFEGQRRPNEIQQLNGASPGAENWVNLLGVAGTAGSCVYALSHSQ
jgi:RHS repeat-associated protein